MLGTTLFFGGRLVLQKIGERSSGAGGCLVPDPSMPRTERKTSCRLCQTHTSCKIAKHLWTVLLRQHVWVNLPLVGTSVPRHLNTVRLCCDTWLTSGPLCSYSIGCLGAEPLAHWISLAAVAAMNWLKPWALPWDLLDFVCVSLLGYFIFQASEEFIISNLSKTKMAICQYPMFSRKKQKPMVTRIPFLP